MRKSTLNDFLSCKRKHKLILSNSATIKSEILKLSVAFPENKSLVLLKETQKTGSSFKILVFVFPFPKPVIILANVSFRVLNI